MLYNKIMLVSVIVTSYNYQQYIKDTINSVLKQTYKNLELIVIDDASTDSSVDIIKEIARNDSRIKLIVNNKRRPESGLPFLKAMIYGEKIILRKKSN